MLDLFPKLPMPLARNRAGKSFSRNLSNLAYICSFVNCRPA